MPPSLARRPLLQALMAMAVAPAAAQDSLLRIGLSRGPAAIDPHFYNGVADKNVAAYIFDRLVEMSAAVTPIPGLALSWTPSSDTVWDFALRPGVTWHDGQSFSADDVVFSLNRAGNVPNSPGGFGPVLRSIAQVAQTGPLSLRITTKEPAPNLPLDLSNVAIVSRHAGEGAATSDYNTGKAAIGTGPYKFVRFAFEDRIELVRNDGWWGPKQDWSSVLLRIIINNASRTAALLSGDVDLIDQPSVDDIGRLEKAPNVQVVSCPGTRTFYLFPDFSRAEQTPFATDSAGQKLAKNPLLDLRVRQALLHGINQKALCERVLQGTGVPTGQWMWPGAYSYAADIKPPEFDPARSRALLSQAGFPAGFRLVLHTADGGSNSPVSQAVAQMWTRIGIATEVAMLPSAMYFGRANKHEFSMAAANWGSNSGEAGYLLNSVLSPRGPFNAGGYDNKAMNVLAAQASATMDPAAREQILIQAVTVAMNDVALIPLYQAQNYWAVRRPFTYQARPDQRTIAMAAHRA